MFKLADVSTGPDGGSFTGGPAVGGTPQWPQGGPQDGPRDGVPLGDGNWVEDGIRVAVYINNLLKNGRSSVQGKLKFDILQIEEDFVTCRFCNEFKVPRAWSIAVTADLFTCPECASGDACGATTSETRGRRVDVR